MSSAAGSVRPSADHAPPLLARKFACTAPVDRSGRAKWYAARMTPALYAPT
jgi:hypothetical protein